MEPKVRLSCLNADDLLEVEAEVTGTMMEEADTLMLLTANPKSVTSPSKQTSEMMEAPTMSSMITAEVVTVADLLVKVLTEVAEAVDVVTDGARH